MRLLIAPGILKGTAMNLQKTGVVILAVAAAALLAASTIDTVPFAAATFASPHEPAQASATAMVPASALPYNHPANTPADATWGSLFSAHWR